jgi:indole-3-glycerol phosphate synthase
MEVLFYLVPAVTSLGFGVLFFLHARGESERIRDIAKAAFVQINSRDSQQAATAQAATDYQEEALRQSREAFDESGAHGHESYQAKRPAKQKLEDKHGNTFTVLEGQV